MSILLLGLLLPAADAPVAYQPDVARVLRKRCVQCHNVDRSEAGLDASSYTALREGSASGPVVVPGKLEESFLWLVVDHQEEPAMPPGGVKMPAAELDVLRKWIEGGALEKPDSTPLVAAMPTGATSSAGAGAEGPIVRRAEGPRAITALAIDPSAGLLVYSGDEQILLFDTATYAFRRAIDFPQADPYVLGLSADGTRLLAAGGSHGEVGRITLFDTKTLAPIRQIEGEFDTVLAADLDPEGRHLAYGGPTRLLKVVDLESGELVHRLDRHTDWARAVSYGPDGLLLASGDRAGNLFVWEAESGELLHILRGQEGSIAGLGWQSAGDVLVSAADDGWVRRWDMHTGKPLGAWAAHEQGALDLNVAANGTIVTAGRDRLVKLWDAQGELVATFGPLDSLPLRAQATPDGGRVVVGDFSGHVTVYDTSTGESLATADVPAEALQPQAEVEKLPAVAYVIAPEPPIDPAGPAAATAGDRPPMTSSASDANDAASLSASLAAMARATDAMVAAEERLREATTRVRQAEAALEATHSDGAAQLVAAVERQEEARLALRRVSQRIAALTELGETYSRLATHAEDLLGPSSDPESSSEEGAELVSHTRLLARQARAGAQRLRDRQARLEKEATAASIDEFLSDRPSVRSIQQAYLVAVGEAASAREAWSEAFAAFELARQAVTQGARTVGVPEPALPEILADQSAASP